MEILLNLNFSLPLILIFIGGILILIELFAGVDSYFDLVLSGTSLAIGGVTGFFSESGLVSMIVSFILLIAYWILGRVYVHKFLETMPHTSNTDGLIGKKLNVTRQTDKNSFVKYEGEEWRIESDKTVAVDDEVEVVGYSGVTLNVKKL